MSSPAVSLPTGRSSRPNFSLALGLFAAVAFLAPARPASAQTTYSSSSLGCTQGGTGVSITTGTQSGSCTINVTGASGTVASVQVQINGITSDVNTGNSLLYTSFMLKGPNGQTFMLLGAGGDGFDNGGISGLNITFKDGASAAPGCFDSTSICNTLPSSGSATYAPTSRWLYGTGAVPAIFAPPNVELPQVDGALDGYSNQTFGSVFAGGAANNGWTLTVENDYPDGNAPVSFTNWSLTLTFAALLPTTTSVSSSLNPSFTASPNNSASYTAAVSASGGTPTGTVAFTANGSTIPGCSAVAVSSGHATCTTSSLSSQGLYNVTAAYGGDSTYGTSSGSVTEVVEVHPTQNGNTWCNPGSVLVPGSNASGSVYPSVIHVSGYPAGQTVSTVEVQLLNVSGYARAQHLLVAPDGSHNLDFFDYGFNANTASGINLNFFDLAGQYPNSNNSPVSANYEAADNAPTSHPDTFPSATAPIIDTGIPQVPGTIHFGYNPEFPSARGPVTSTFENEFNGAPADGDWAIYPFESESSPETIAGGWCLQLSLNTGVGTTTTVTSSANPGKMGSAVTLTATVNETGSGTPVTSGGTVTFTENGAAPAGTVSGNNVATVNSNGQATFTSSALTEGDHEIVATYNGDTSDNASTTAFWQRIDNATTMTSDSTSFTFCNAGAISTPIGSAGGATPNPSVIAVSKLPGTVSAMTLSLKGVSSTVPTFVMESLVKGPTGNALDFFSNTGNTSGTGTVGSGDYVFADGNPMVGQGNLTQGTYGPSSYQNQFNASDSFVSSSSGFYNAPGTFNYAGPTGSSTFSSTFANTSPNGNWTLFFNQSEPQSAAFHVLNGWCLNLRETKPAITVQTAHSSDFSQGQSDAQFTVDITNDGSGSTGDPTASNPLTVTDVLDSHLTFGGLYAGSGWTCTGTTTVTCTNDSSVTDQAPGNTYPELTIDVTVAANAPTSINNSVSVSGAGVTPTSSNTDAITVDAQTTTAASSTSATFSVSTQTVTLSATVTSTAGTVSSGTVTFDVFSGSTLIGTGATSGTVSSGAASVIYSLPAGTPAGIYSIHASYNGSGSYASSSDTTHTLTINGAGTTTTVAVDDPVLSGAWSGTETAGASANGAATVSSGGPGAPTGTVTYTLYNAPGCSSGSIGTSTVTLSSGSVPLSSAFGPLGAGVFYLSASYSGDSNYLSSTSTCTSFFVLKDFPTVSVTSSLNPSNYGQSVNLTATINSGYVPSGTVGFTSNGTDITGCTAVTVSSGTAACVTTSLLAGTDAIVATYSGDTNNNSAPGSLVGGQLVISPNLVVNETTDDAGNASNCVPQTTAGTTTNSDTCSLRDALLFAANAGGGNISFDAATFLATNTALDNTIPLGSGGTLTVPNNTIITGATSGSGATLSNLVTVSGSNAVGVFNVNSGATTTLNNLIVANGTSASGGSGLTNAGTTTIANSTFTGNQAIGGAAGGAIENSGTVSISGSTFTSNSATGGGNGGAIDSNSTVNLVNSTISGNSVDTAAKGGGIENTGTLNITNSTISNNTNAGGAGGGIESSGTVNMANSIVAGNTATNSPDFNGSASSGSANNIIGDGTGLTGISNGSAGNQIGTNATPVDPQLAALGSYGGPTQTLLPRPGSPAICGGGASVDTGAGITTDQRGFGFLSTYCPSGFVDTGAVQTNYLLTLGIEPPPTVGVGVAITPSPTVVLDESLVPAATAIGSVTVADTDSALTPGSTLTVSLSSGTATFDNLAIGALEPTDGLTATFALTGTINLTTTSNTFSVVQSAVTITPIITTPQSAQVNAAFAPAGPPGPLAVTVTDGLGVPVPNLAGIVFTANTGSYGGTGTFSNSTNTITVSTDSNGIADPGAFTANTVADSYNVDVSVTGTGVTATFNLTNNAGPAAKLALMNYFTGAPTWPTEFTGWPVWFTVTAEDQYNNPITGFTDTVQVTSSTDAGATLPSSLTFCTCGSAYFPVTFDAAGTQAITVSDTTNPAVTAGAASITVQVPDKIVVTAAGTAADTDFPEVAGNCTAQSDPLNPTDPGCTLRDALAYSAAHGAATITFSPNAFTGSNATLTLVNGALEIPNDTSITGLSSGITVSGNGASGVFQMSDPTAQGSITRMTITGGMVNDSSPNLSVGGAAIYNDGTLTVDHSTISGNSATSSTEALGGAIYSDNDLEIFNTTVSGNTATATGGAAAFGGGIYSSSYMNASNLTVIQNVASAPGSGGFAAGGGLITSDADIDESTFSANTAQGPNDGSGSALAGGIFGLGTVWTAYTTITGNTATAGAQGTAGGLYVGAYQELYNSTIAGNNADADAGGLLLDSGSEMVLANTIIANNSAPSNVDFDGIGTPLDDGGNLIGDGSGESGITNGVNGNQVGMPGSLVDPMLTSVGNYGGPNLTMLPLPGSPAICAGLQANVLQSGDTTDERGFQNVNTSYPGYTSPGTACVDSGAVQTNYSLAFSMQPSPISPDISLYYQTNFQAAVTLSESGVPATSGVTIPLTLHGRGTLTGGSAATSAGVATYSPLKISLSDASDTLSANLPLNSSASPAVAIAATSSSFVIGGPPYGSLDKAIDARTRSTTVALADNLSVTGWAIDPKDGAPVNEVQILIDGAIVGTATLGLHRSDLTGFPTAGWSFTYAASGLSLGTHTVKAVVYDSLSLSSTIGTRNFTVASTSTGPPYGNLERAVDTATNSPTVALADILAVSGWAVDPQDGAPVNQVQILIDGNAVGNATLSLPRADIAGHPNSGWSFTYAVSGLSVGSHTVSAVAYDSLSLSSILGTASITVSSVRVNPPRGSLDKAVDAVTHSTTVGKADNLRVTGWAVDPQDGAPVSKVQILIDDIVVGNATLGLSRSDIAGFPTAGWSFTYAVSGLSLGIHTVKAVAYDSLNLSTTLGTKAITVSLTSTGPPYGFLDSALDATTHSSTVALADNLRVTGWAVDPQDGAPVSQVQILVDGNVVGTATLGLSRPDIAGYPNSGWSFTYAVSGLSIGTHTVSAVASDSLSLSTTLGTKTIFVGP